MDIAVEISFYPLTERFAPLIHEFIARLNAAGDLKVVSGSLGTQVVGEYERVFETLRREMRSLLEDRGEHSGKAVFVMKLLGPLYGPPRRAGSPRRAGQAPRAPAVLLARGIAKRQTSKLGPGDRLELSGT